MARHLVDHLRQHPDQTAQTKDATKTSNPTDHHTQKEQHKEQPGKNIQSFSYKTHYCLSLTLVKKTHLRVSFLTLTGHLNVRGREQEHLIRNSFDGTVQTKDQTGQIGRAHV